MATRCGTEVDGRLVEIEFDRRKLVLNQVRLFVDGMQVDGKHVFYGDKDLRAMVDGREIVVTVTSGMVGEMLRAQVRRDDGSWVDLVERAPA